MATARALLGQAQRITINIGGGSNSPGLIIGDTDTVSFYSTAPFPVEIQFICANGPVFNNIARIGTNQSSPAQAPQETQITTDYLIINLNTGAAQGPYSIEVTINPQTPAPLLIPIVNAAPPANETVVSIPTYGWIQFDFDVAYALTWSSGVFPSGTFGPGLSPAWQVPPGNEIPTLTYSLNGGVPRGGTQISKIAKVGGGSVKIRS